MTTRRRAFSRVITVRRWRKYSWTSPVAAPRKPDDVNQCSRGTQPPRHRLAPHRRDAVAAQISSDLVVAAVARADLLANADPDFVGVHADLRQQQRQLFRP